MPNADAATPGVDSKIFLDSSGGTAVSVVIAAHNAAAFIHKAIASACGQSLRPIEILVVDDGSSDGTVALVQAAAARDARIKLIELPRNRGVSVARNEALRQAAGRWIAILDADDAFSPDRLEKMLEFAERNELDMVADNLEMHDFETGAPIGRAFPDGWMRTDRDVSLRYLLEHDIPGIWPREMGFFKPMIRRAFLETHGLRYAEDVYSAEDLLLYAQCLRAGARMRFMPAAYYRYALRQGSLSSLKTSSQSNKKVCQILLDSVPATQPRQAALLRLRRAATNYEIFIHHVRHREYGPALKTAAEMPKLFLARKLNVFLLRRLGRSPENPTLRMLNSINRKAWAS